MKKAVLPSLREKKRYLAFEVVSKDKFSFTEIKKTILQSCKEFLGQLGMAKAGIIVLGDKYERNKGLIRINHKYVNELKASLALIKKPTVKSTGVSGMLNKAYKKYVKMEGK